MNEFGQSMRARVREVCRLNVHLVVLLCFVGMTSAHAATLTATLDRDTIAAGESATLSLTFEGGTPASVPSVPAPAQVSIRFGGQSHQFSMVNGQSTSSLTYTYQLTASEPGQYTLGPFRGQVGGQVIVSQPVRLNVLKSSPTPSAPDATTQLAFLRLIVPKTNVYVGETFVIEAQLFLAVNYDNVEMPQIQGDGFIFGKIPQPNGSRTQIGNRPYVVFPFKTSAVAVKSGSLTLGPVRCSVILQVPVNRRGRDLLDDFFGPRVQRTPITVSSDPQPMTVLPLPSENRPPDFNGAVGTFSVRAHASPTNLMAGDPITLRVQISGEGNLESLLFPGGADWPAFKLYPPTSKMESSDPLGLTGVKTFERVVIPQRAEIKEVPPIRFSYFDPQQKAYHTAATPAIPIAVRPSQGGQSTPTVFANDESADDAEPATRDIVHVKPYLGTVASLPTPLVLQPWFLGLQAVPLAICIGAWIWRWRRDRLENNPRLRRRRLVADSVRKGIRDLAHSAQAQDSEAFFAGVFRLLQEQLGERLDLPASAITEAVLDERLRGRASNALIDRLHSLFQACNQARYAPHHSTAELMNLVPEVESALNQLRQLPG